MKEVKIKDQMLQKAAAEGMDEFVKVFVDAISEAVDGSLNSDNMAELNADQITLLAYHYLHEEVMSGGFVQLIHNGYGAFIYKNPTAKPFVNGAFTSSTDSSERVILSIRNIMKP